MKILWEKIEKFKSLRLLNEGNFQKFQTEIWEILFIFGDIMALASTFQ